MATLSRIEQGMLAIDGRRIPLGYQQITSLSSATALTVPSNARLAIINPEIEDVRWRDDGTSPTSSVGMIIKENDYFFYTGSGTGDLSAIKFIEVASGAKINVSYYR